MLNSKQLQRELLMMMKALQYSPIPATPEFDIINSVCNALEVDYESVSSKNRSNENSFARFIIFQLLRQHTALSYKQIGKLFIVISQAEGRSPKGRMAKDVMYDADLKIWVEGHRAISKGRYIGTKGYYTNWIEGAAKYWGPEETIAI